MSAYRDLGAALERIDRLEFANVELRARLRTRDDSLLSFAAVTLVAAAVSVITLVGWLLG